MTQQELERTRPKPLSEWDEWRDEIRTFYRQTAAEIHRIVQGAVSFSRGTASCPPASASQKVEDTSDRLAPLSYPDSGAVPTMLLEGLSSGLPCP